MPCLFAVTCLCGCSPQSAPGKVEDSLTSGRISVVCAPEAYGLIVRERAAFCADYPQASIDVRVGSSRDAVGALFAATADLAVIARELEPDERRAALRGGLELEGYRFARDAVVMVVNPGNPVENLSLDAVRRIYRGEVERWSELGGTRAPLVPTLQPPRSDITEFFIQEVMGGEPVLAQVRYESSDSEVVVTAMRDPDALGYVSLNWASRGAKVIRLASLTGLPYWKPDLEAVYKGEYPLTRFFNLYVRSAGPSLANGFITFVTSYRGQRLVREHGLVPTAVPVRFVRRSPLLSTH